MWNEEYVLKEEMEVPVLAERQAKAQAICG